ncbi:flavodoxin family protein [Patulibacter americanus]|uniref:flavodoxin family protein n=1 Tax=Patulibacter americanus TaxID=588672 RepID=UPI0003B31C11|nr:flavodoxin family protein [Patulibacter americanus]
MSTVSIAIPYFSGYGHTARFADAVRDGAASVPDSVAHLVNVAELDDADWARLDEADAIIFGSPTYMGTAATAFHAFAEATSKRWMERAWQDKLASGFTNSGSMSGDKLNTLQYFAMLASQHGMHWVSLNLMPTWNTTGGSDLEDNRLGFYLGAGAQTPVDAAADAVHPADLSTARHLGRRVAEQAHIYTRGREVPALAA